MICFKSFLLNESKEIPWDHSDTGWWGDGKTVTVFHGTHKRNIDDILKNGLTRKDPDTGMISLALEPHTAKGHAAMSSAGGEHHFRKSNAKIEHTPMSDQAVFKLVIPRDWLEKHVDKNLSGNVGEAKKRMQSKDEYVQFKEHTKKPDYAYYQLAELRVKDAVPAKFIKGVMFPK